MVKREKKMKKLFACTLITLSLCALPAFAGAVETPAAGAADLQVLSLQEYNGAAVALSEASGWEPGVDYVLNTSEGAIPIYIEDEQAPIKPELEDVQAFMGNALQAQQEETANAQEEYEFIQVDPDVTYIYRDYLPEKSLVLTNTDAVTEAEAEAFSTRAGNPTDLPNGIGGKAVTYSSSVNTFSANVTANNLSFASSVPDDGFNNGVAFYNYLGFSASGVETDLGLQWSNKNQGWNPYFLFSGKNGKETIANGKADVIAGSENDLYKATPSYPTTLSIDRNYKCSDNVYRVKLNVKGTKTNMNSGVTTVVGGYGVSGSVKYKALSTVTAGSESKIKTGTKIDATFSSVKIGSSAVSTYSQVLYDNTTIPSYYPNLVYNVKKQ